MKRSRALIAVFGTFVLLVIVIASVVVVFLRAGEQRNQALKIINEVVEQQRIRHERVEQARAKLPRDSALPGDWSLEQAMVTWQDDEIEALEELARHFLQGQEASVDDKARFTRFVMTSPELGELTEAVKRGLCEITLDPAKGQWQISRTQVRALKSMTYMLSARAILLAEEGDSQGALKTILDSYALMNVLSDTPNIHLQSYRPGMLSYIDRAIRCALSPDEISVESRAVLIRYLERQSSTEPIVNALKLHEALVRLEVSAKHSTIMESWLLAGYHRGVERIIKSLGEPQRSVSQPWNEIINDAPWYAGQTRWRLQNITPDALQAGDNLQRHVRSVSDFLGLRGNGVAAEEIPGKSKSKQIVLVEASGKIDLRILYAGLLETDRAKDFVSFLAAHFEKVETTDYLTFNETESAGFDVTIIDSDGVDLDVSKTLFKLSHQYAHAAITVGVPGAFICSNLSLKTGYL